ncbi:MAG: hypothetical protein HC905_12580 [Bacteroidales bacterium]|nr:hypothetical protein [Bacteroidales bacterium]
MGHDSMQTVLYDSFWNPIFDSAEFGDSIYKNDGSISLFIVGNDKNEKEIKYNPSTFYFHKRKWNNDELKIDNK